ncbi:MAG: DNA polymerase III subunit delta [Bacillota bacterium]
MKQTDFYKQITEDRLLRTYLFLGEERLFHEELLDLVTGKLLSAEDREFNFTRLDASVIEPVDLTNNLETPPFFGGVRVIYLDGLENGVSGVDEALLKTLSNIADGIYLFASASKLDGRKKSSQEIQKRIPVVDCSKLRPQELPVWIKNRSEKMGLRLTPVQIRTIARRLGSNLLRIRTELIKIKTFLGAKSELTDSDLELLIPGEPEPDIFALIDAVADRNPKMGLPRLEELLNSGENEVKILATVARQFRNITAANVGRRKGLTPKALADFLGINPYVAEKSFLQSGRFSLLELQQILDRLVQADYRIKTGQREPRLELELAVVEICTGIPKRI